MKKLAALAGILALAGVAFSSAGATAETALEKAIEGGASQLTADQIADRIVGKTVTVAAGDKRFLFHYSADNVLSGMLIGGGWSDTGYYGITDDNRVCLSMSQDKGRLRCLTLLERNGAVKKYRTDGKMSFELLEYNDGKTF